MQNVTGEPFELPPIDLDRGIVEGVHHGELAEIFVVPELLKLRVIAGTGGESRLGDTLLPSRDRVPGDEKDVVAEGGDGDDR
jgi:hypothetical protein